MQTTLPIDFAFEPMDISPEFNNPEQYTQRLMLKVATMEIRISELENWRMKRDNGKHTSSDGGSECRSVYGGND